MSIVSRIGRIVVRLERGLLVLLLVPVFHLLALTLRADEGSLPRTGPAWDARHEKLSRAAVFMPSPPPDFTSIDVARVPTGVALSDRQLECRFVPKPNSGTTPKFDCELTDGTVVKVKYGRTAERSGEVAATRILAALGFGADRVEFIEELRCFGCPPSPYRLRQLAELFFLGEQLDWLVDYARARSFEWVTVERNLPGRAVEVGAFKGWGWFDLDRVDSRHGGASRAELDALRLVAVFLTHWDNKEGNQRLTCLDDPDGPDDAPCRRPLIMLQDLGSTFGPTKVEWHEWKRAEIWADRATCLVSMKTMPYGPGTFVDAEISEAGRRLLADRLRQFTAPQLVALFTAARFPDPVTGFEPAADVRPWVDVFLARVSAIADRPPCPSSSTPARAD